MNKAKSVTARFYRLRAFDEGEEQKIGSLDIRALLNAYGAQDASHRYREVRGSQYLYATVSGHPRGLAIHRLRDPSDSLTRVDSHGIVDEVMAVDEDGRSYADTSCVLFSADHPIFSIVRGAGTAPTHQRVAEWLTDLNPLAGCPTAAFSAIAMTNQARIDAVKAADGARRIDLQFPLHVRHEFGISMSKDKDRLKGLDPDTTVKVSLSMGNRHPRSDEGKGLLDVIKDILPKLEFAEKASAGVYREVPTKAKKKGTEKTRMDAESVDLMETMLSARFALQVDGASVRIETTLAAMEREEQNLYADILDAWENDDHDLSEVDRPSQG